MWNCKGIGKVKRKGRTRLQEKYTCGSIFKNMHRENKHRNEYACHSEIHALTFRTQCHGLTVSPVKTLHLEYKLLHRRERFLITAVYISIHFSDLFSYQGCQITDMYLIPHLSTQIISCLVHWEYGQPSRCIPSNDTIKCATLCCWQLLQKLRVQLSLGFFLLLGCVDHNCVTIGSVICPDNFFSCPHYLLQDACIVLRQPFMHMHDLWLGLSKKILQLSSVMLLSTHLQSIMLIPFL